MRTAIGATILGLILIASGPAAAASHSSVPATSQRSSHGGFGGNQPCPTGYSQKQGQCFCPTGNIVVHHRCVAPDSCPPGGQPAGDQCVAPATCPAGYHLKNGQCLAPLKSANRR